MAVLAAGNAAAALQVTVDTNLPKPKLKVPEALQVTVDNCTTSSYTVVGVVCRDRKGLVYDLFRTLKDIHIRVAYAKARCAQPACQAGLQRLESAWMEH